MKQFQDLGLINYQLLHIHTDSAEVAQRLQAHYVGCIPSKSVVLTLPRAADGRLSVSGRLRAGDNVSVKVSTGNGLATFSTKVLGIAPTPFPLLHLAYPKTLSFKNVRKDPRVEIAIPIEMTFNSGVKSNGQFSDISVSGGRILIEHVGADVGESVEVTFDLSVAGVPRPITVTANIRTCFDVPGNSEATARGERVYGVEFNAMDELQVLIVSAFINAELAKMHAGGR